MGLQFWSAVLIRKSEFGAAAFEWLADRFEEFFKYSDKGAVLLFGSSYLDHRFIFGVRTFLTCSLKLCFSTANNLCILLLFFLFSLLRSVILLV